MYVSVTLILEVRCAFLYQVTLHQVKVGSISSEIIWSICVRTDHFNCKGQVLIGLPGNRVLGKRKEVKLGNDLGYICTGHVNLKGQMLFVTLRLEHRYTFT